MTLAEEINSIVKTKKIIQSLPTLPAQIGIDSVNGGSGLEEDDDSSSGLVAPLTLEILTYDDTADIDFKDTTDTTHTLKTAATAKIIDANGDEYIIETITYADP